LKARKELVLIPASDEKAALGAIARIAEGYKGQQAVVLVFVRSIEAVGTVRKELEKATTAKTGKKAGSGHRVGTPK
jgi:hypothetical protein